MSNRNHHHVTKSQSKSPQLTNYIKMKQQQLYSNLDKDLIKKLILTKISQQKQPIQTVESDQDDDLDANEALDFKQEIERRYKKCNNKAFKFPLESSFHDSEGSIQSLKNVTVYNLRMQNQGVGILEEDQQNEEDEKLTDATQYEFVKQVNEKLILHLKNFVETTTDVGIKIKTEGNADDDDHEDPNYYLSNQQKQFNYANQKQPVRQFKAKQANYNFSDTSLVLLTNDRKLGQ